MKTFKLTVTEDELRALIRHHANSLTYTGSINAIGMDYSNYSTETSERIHTLTKRLNKETPEIESDPRPQETTAQGPSAQEQSAVEQVKIPEGW
jgi:hypothetical protein